MHVKTLSLRLFICSAILMGIFGCGKKKDKKPTLESWLETNLPGQLTIVGNIVDLDPRNPFTSKTQTILADSKDTDVQIKVTWYKKEEGLGLNKDEVQSMLESSRKDVKAAREILQGLKAKGADKISVAVIDMAAYILLYEEPTPEVRNRYADLVLSVITAMPEHTQKSIWIECMEPAVYGEHFKDIVPFGYWRRGDSYHDSKKIMSLDFEWNADLKTEHLLPHWTYNYNSERVSAMSDAAYQEALSWAGKHLSSPFYLEPHQMIQYGLNAADSLAIEYSFPYYESKPDTSQSSYEYEPLGHVNVSYQTDQKKFFGIGKTEAQ